MHRTAHHTKNDPAQISVMPRFRAAGAGDISLGGISMYIEIKAVSIMILQSEKKVRLE